MVMTDFFFNVLGVVLETFSWWNKIPILHIIIQFANGTFSLYTVRPPLTFFGTKKSETLCKLKIALIEASNVCTNGSTKKSALTEVLSKNCTNTEVSSTSKRDHQKPALFQKSH